jgi:hypothetical protein
MADFTLNIIAPDGKVYYEIPSSSLRSPKPVTELMEQLIGMSVNLAHKPYDPAIELVGTFIINLSVYYPKE